MLLVRDVVRVVEQHSGWVVQKTARQINGLRVWSDISYDNGTIESWIIETDWEVKPTLAVSSLNAGEAIYSWSCYSWSCSALDIVSWSQIVLPFWPCWAKGTVSVVADKAERVEKTSLFQRWFIRLRFFIFVSTNELSAPTMRTLVKRMALHIPSYVFR